MHVAQNARVFCDMHKNKDLERVAWLHLNAMRFMFGTRAQGLFQRQMDFREQVRRGDFPRIVEIFLEHHAVADRAAGLRQPSRIEPLAFGISA